MTVAEFDALEDITLEVMRPLHEYMIEDFYRRVAKAGEITQTAAYKAYRRQALNGADEALKTALKEQGILTDKAIGELFGYLAERTVAFADNGSLQQMVQAYKKVAAKNLKHMTKNLGILIYTGEVVPIGEAYAQSMDFAFKQVFSGAADYTSALREATKGLAERGVRYITRESPKARTLGIEYATRNTLMTQMGMLNQEVANASHDALGCNGWEISAHAGCAEDHEPIQGRQYSDAAYKKLNAELKRPIGMFFCGHFALPITLGVNSPQYSEAQLEKLRLDNARGLYYDGRHYTLYKAGQQQNYIENSIRQTRTQILAARTAGDAKQLREHEIHLGVLQAEYRRFNAATGFPSRSERLQVAGFGRSESAAARATLRSLVS